MSFWNYRSFIIIRFIIICLMMTERQQKPNTQLVIITGLNCGAHYSWTRSLHFAQQQHCFTRQFKISNDVMTMKRVTLEIGR